MIRLAREPVRAGLRPAGLSPHIAGIREARYPGAATEVITAMPRGKARFTLARRFKTA